MPNGKSDDIAVCELAKAAAKLPWAFTLFGLHQAANLFGPRGHGVRQVTSQLSAVTTATIEPFKKNLKTAFGVGEAIQSQIVEIMFGAGSSGMRQANPEDSGNDKTTLPVFSASSEAQEEILISYTIGEGRFSDDRKFITLNNRIFLLDGRSFGVHQGVWERQFESPQDLMTKPNSPSPPLNEPVGPVEKGFIAAHTKAVWAFDDGEVFSVGPAASHLVQLDDGSFLFLVSTAQVVTHGTGRFKGVFGLSQSLGATHIPFGVDLFSGENRPFPATTLDTFKLRVVPSSAQAISPSKTESLDSSTISTLQVASRESVPSSADSPNSRYVEVNGSRMHYVDVGVGETILFLHGNPVWSYVWRNVIPHVAKSARCIAPDLIGMGKSDKPDIEYRFFDHVKYLEGFINTLQLKDITIVTHDWGCMLGFFYAMRTPKNVKAMIFMEAMLQPYRDWNDFPEPLRRHFQAFRTPDVGLERVVINNEFVEQLLPNSMIRKLSESEMEMYRFPFRMTQHRKVIWRFANELPIGGQPADVTRAVTEYSRWLKDSEIPKLLLFGEPGAITTKTDVKWALEHLKNLQAVSVGKGIHFLQEDNPEAIGCEIARWHSAIRRKWS